MTDKKTEKICIFTDSASDITHEEAERWDVKVAPLHVTVDDQTYLEYYEISPQEYWKMLEESETFPQTAQVGMEWFLNLYKQARAHQRLRFRHLSGGVHHARHVLRRVRRGYDD